MLQQGSHADRLHTITLLLSSLMRQVGDDRILTAAAVHERQ